MWISVSLAMAPTSPCSCWTLTLRATPLCLVCTPLGVSPTLLLQLLALDVYGAVCMIVLVLRAHARAAWWPLVVVYHLRDSPNVAPFPLRALPSDSYGGFRMLADNGGGVFIQSPDDLPANLLYCGTDFYAASEYRVWTPSSTVRVVNTRIANNSAVCGTCSGGGLALLPGGELIIEHSLIANNSAGLFGGGVYAGGASAGLSSCGITLADGTVVADNWSGRGGSQIYSSCGGNVTFSSAAVDMRMSSLEVNCELSVCMCMCMCMRRCPMQFYRLVQCGTVGARLLVGHC